MIQDQHHTHRNAGPERRVGLKHRRRSSSGSNGSVFSRVLGTFRKKSREEKKKKKSSLDSVESQDEWASAAAVDYQGTHFPDRPQVDKRVKTILSDDDYAAEIERMQERSQAHYTDGGERAVSRSSSQITDLPNFSYSTKSPKHRKSSASTTSPTFSTFPMFQGHEWPQPPREFGSIPDQFQPPPPPQPTSQQPHSQSVVSPVSPGPRTIQVYNGHASADLDRGRIVRHIALTKPQLLAPRKAPSPPKPKPQPQSQSPPASTPPSSPLPSPSLLPSPPRLITPHATPATSSPGGEASSRRESFYKQKRASSDLTLGDASSTHTHRHSIYHNPNATTTGLGLLSPPAHSPPTSPKTPAPPPAGRAEGDAYFPAELARMCPWPGCAAVLGTEQERADNLCASCHSSLYPRESAFFERQSRGHSPKANNRPGLPTHVEDADTLKALVGTKVSMAENVKINKTPRGSVKLVNSKFSSMSSFKLQPPPLGKRAQAQAPNGSVPHTPTSPTSSTQSPMQTRRPSQLGSSISSQPRSSTSSQPRPSFGYRNHNANNGKQLISGKHNKHDHDHDHEHQSTMVQPLPPSNSSSMSGPGRPQHIGFQDVRWEPPSPKVARRKTNAIKFKPTFKSSFKPDPYANRVSRRISRYSRVSHASTRTESPSLSDGSWMTDSAASSSSVCSSPDDVEHEKGFDRKREDSHPRSPPPLQIPPRTLPAPEPAPAHKEHHVQFAIPAPRRPSLSHRERPPSQLVAVRQEKPQPSRETILYREIEDIIDCYTMGGDCDEENERRKADTIASFFTKEPEAVQMRKKGFI